MILLGVPMFLAARAWQWFDTWTNRKVCATFGCDTEWVYAPVCQRCGTVAGRETQA